MEKTEAPIFIVGANRSGTTLLRLILNAHSQIGIPEELTYFNSYMAGVPIEQWRDPELSSPAYADFVADFLASNPTAMNVVDSDAIKRKILDVANGQRDFRRPYQLTLQAWVQQQGKVRWGEKTPGNLFYADIIRDMFSGAMFIHLVRNPHAAVSSMMRAPFFSDDVTFNALTWRKHLRKGRDILEDSVPSTQRMTLRYEDLVSKPESTMRTVCDFLGERYEPAMLRFHEDAAAHMKSEAASGFNEAATRPISSDKIDKWKDHLSTDQIAVIEHVCAPQMHEFGYELVGSRLPWPEWVEWRVKTAYWRIQSWRNRHVRHYAVKHPLLARTRARLRALLGRE